VGLAVGSWQLAVGGFARRSLGEGGLAVGSWQLAASPAVALAKAV